MNKLKIPEKYTHCFFHVFSSFCLIFYFFAPKWDKKDGKTCKNKISTSKLGVHLQVKIYNYCFCVFHILSCSCFFRCCRKMFNTTCYPIMDIKGKPDRLPDGTPCYQGFCNMVRQKRNPGHEVNLFNCYFFSFVRSLKKCP